MRGYQEQGYRVVKMKIGGADLATDLKRIEAVIEVAGKGENVAVDANGRFDLATALAYGKAMQPYGLFWYEEPGDPLDFQLNAVLAGAAMPARSRPARTCSPPSTARTCCATAACGPIATGCSSIRR